MQQISYKNHREWLEKRRQGIGGSDAAAIVGLNPFSSPYSVWANKLGLAPDFKGNEATRQGTDLEEYVAKRFTEKTGKKIRRKNKILKNPKYPFALADVDRLIVGENAGLECKTTSSFNYSKFNEEEIPTNYYIQCLHYMAVTGADKWYLAVLVFSKDFLVYEIERDEEMIEGLMKAEEEFWELVKNETPPPVDGAESTDKVLNILYNKPENNSVDLFYMRDKAERLVELKRKEKEIQAERKLLEQEFKAELGNNEIGKLDGFYMSWKPQERKTFQSKAFIKDHKDMDFSKYYKTSTSRVFKFKKEGE